MIRISFFINVGKHILLTALLGIMLTLLYSTSALCQNNTVSGTTKDTQTGETLPGVNIKVKGTTTGTSTNAKGHYSLDVPSKQDTLIFSYIGYKQQVIPIKGRSTINVAMNPSTISGKQMVVVGYGTQRKEDVTGSMTSINLENSAIEDIPNTNILSSLKGQVSGLRVAPSNSPGEQPRIQIRGQHSINGSNAPLIVLDGAIYHGSLNNISPNSIATSNVLKGASAAAIYGSRASNGVIVLTSKKGHKGKPTINFKMTQGVNVWQQKPNVMSPSQYIKFRLTKKGVNKVSDLPQFPVPEERNYKAGKTVDWISLGSHAGYKQNYNLSVSGGGQGVNYYISSAFDNENGVMIGDKFQRADLMGRVGTDITEWLKVDVQGRFSHSTNAGISVDKLALLRGNPYGDVYVHKRNGDLFMPDGKKILERFPGGSGPDNPLWGTQGTIKDAQSLQSFYFSGQATVDVPHVKGLSYKLHYTGKLNTNNTARFENPKYFVDEGFGTKPPIQRYGDVALREKLRLANGNKISRTQRYLNIDNIVHYKRRFNRNNIDATFAYTRDHSYNGNIGVTGKDFSTLGNVTLGYNGLPKSDITNFSNDIVESANIAYLGRLSYSYAGKYHLTASVRRDGASVFGKDKKWGTFPSVGIAWTISKEKFLKPNTILNNLKLRVSYGKNGNQGLSPYQTLTRVATGRSGGLAYEFGDQPSTIKYGQAIESLGNPNLGWETTSSINAGIDAALWRNRVRLSINYYYSKTTDQIFDRNIPSFGGFSQIKASLGQVNNQGVNIDLNTKNIKNAAVSWSSNVNFSLNRNKLAHLYGDGKNDISNNLFIGKSLGAIYGFQPVGIVQKSDEKYINISGAQPGDVKYKDINGPNGKPDGRITAEYDRKILGYRKENFFINFSNTVNYKGFRFYVLLSGIFGGGKNNYYLASNRSAYEFLGITEFNQPDHPYWTSTNKSNTYPRIRYENTTRFLGLQSRSFVSIENINISYGFSNQSWIQKLGVKSLKIYGNIQNLYYFTNWSGGNPDANIGVFSDKKPVPSVYTGGIEIKF